jgi:hypothetical protein
MASSIKVQETLAYCTSCKMDLNHTVVAMKGDRIAKVQCRTCKKEHTYKAPKNITDPTQIPAKKPRATKEEKAASSTPVEVEWQKLMSAHAQAEIRTYSARSAFALADKIKHPTFGEGIVNKLIYPNKVEVIFQSDIKILIHAGERV